MRSKLKAFIVVAFVGGTALSFADTLIDRKTGRAVGVGRATIDNQVIHWTPCRSSAAVDYALQQYKIVEGDNCEISALPHTASSLPLIGALGFTLFAIGLALHIRGWALPDTKNITK